MNTRLPQWLRQDIPDNDVLGKMRLLAQRKISTVCQQAHCPNISGCFKNHEFTFMILGDICTRNCLYCAVTKSASLKGSDLDPAEPERIAALKNDIGVEYAVITSVTRDDLSDGGAGEFANTIRCVRSVKKDIDIEALIPDFKGKPESIRMVVEASPSVIGHNLETVRRLYEALRPRASYERSLAVLKMIKETGPGTVTKSSLMLGLGETEEEVIEALRDLRESRCDIIVLGQYLAPSSRHYPVSEFISLEKFEEYRRIALGLGFKAVLSKPKARSSYNAKELYRGAYNA